MTEATHHLEITINHGRIDHLFSCTAAEGARCRLVCGDDCEEFSWDHEQDMREGFLADGRTEEQAAALASLHRLVDNGECNLLAFISNDEAGLEELYTGDPQPLRGGDVELKYDGDYVSWSYA